MKRLLYFLTFLAVTDAIYPKNSKLNLLGTIQFPCCVDQIPNIPVYYKGKKIEVDSGSFIIKEKNNPEIFLLISECVEPKAKQIIENDIQYKKTCPVTSGTEPYKYFLISPKNEFSDHLKQKLNLNQNQKNYPYWDIKEIKIDKKNDFELPDNTLIIIYDPQNIEKVVEENFKNNDNKTLNLPKIIIKTIEKEKLLASATKALLISLNLDAIHEKPDKKELKNAKVTISMR